MGFKDNLEEKEELRQYRKKEKIFFFVLFFGLSLFILTVLGGSNTTLHGMVLRVPFSERSRGTDILLLGVMAGYFFWYKGFKWAWMLYPFTKLPSVGTKLDNFLEKAKKGKEEKLEEFFYPKVEFSDGIPRGKSFTYFRSNRLTPYNLFDFGKYTAKNGTKQIIANFRDKEIEAAKRALRSRRDNRRKKAEIHLSRLEQDKAENICTSNQEKLYTDLFLMLEGIYNSYANDFGDKIFIDKKLKNPLRITKFKNSGRIAGIWADKEVDVFRNSKVYFSIDMIMSTARDLTYLYITFLEKRLERGRFKSVNKKNLARFEMFFKFFITRRILMNYSNIPSGWLCVKIEDYTMRAIASNIDREMIIDINEKNNGSTPAYDSDVEASQFLFTYWAFFYEDKIKKVMEELEFIYNTTKEVKEINAREVAREALAQIEEEWKAEYDAFSDSDIVELQPKDVEEE